MNAWFKSIKTNKANNRFSSSTVSGLNRTQLQTIPQTQQNSSQDNATLQSSQTKQNIFYENYAASSSNKVSRIDSNFMKTDQLIKNPKNQISKVQKINQPSSYNSEIMKFQNDDYSSSSNSKSNLFAYDNNSMQNLVKPQFSQEQYYRTTSTSNIIAKIQNNNSGNYLQVKQKKLKQDQYIQSDPNSINFFNNFKSKIIQKELKTQKEEKNNQKIKYQKNFAFKSHYQEQKVRQTKIFKTQSNLNKIDSLTSSYQTDSKANLILNNKKLKFLSSFNQHSSQSVEKNNRQYLRTGRSKQFNIDSNTSRSKQLNINSKSMRATTGKNLQHLRQYTICIMEYCSKEVGLACYNNSTGQIVLSQIIQNMTYFKTLSTVQRYYPIQIIYSQTMEKSLLIKKLIQKFKRTTFRPVNRRNFDQTRGFFLYNQRSIKSQYNPNNKFIAYACFNSLILYLQSFLESKLKYQILQIKWHRLQEVLAIQTQTIVDLEIFTNFQTKKVHNSFIQNFRCRTYGGTRMLRANILQPSSCQKIIFERQQLVQKLLQNQNLMSSLQIQLIKFKLYQPVTSKFIQNPRQQNLKSLKVFLSSILLLCHQCIQLKNLENKLTSFQAAVLQFPVICDLKKKLQSKKLQQLRDIIEQNFNQDILKNYEQVKNKNDKFIFLFKVQKIQDQYAEVTRITYSQTINSILQIFQSIKSKSKQDLKLLYNDARGYFISAKKDIDLMGLADRIKQNIIHISKRGKSITFSTSILVSLNNRLKQSQRVLIFQSQSILRKVISDIQQNIDILFEINHFISTLDMILAFAGFIQKNSHIKFVKPIFSKGSNVFKVQNLNSVWFNQSQNDNQPLFSFQNSYQKSIFCFQKQENSFEQQAIIFSIGYSVILSQIGCFVPADYVSLDLFDSLISKIQLHQTIQMNMSRFQLTISHFSNIVQNCTTKSQRCLVLIDELVKGTQHNQQCALSLAIVEQFRKNRGLTIVLSSDRMLLSILSKFKKVAVSFSKKGINNKQRYEQTNNWILNTCQQDNFDNDFISFLKQLDIQDDFAKFQDIHQCTDKKQEKKRRIEIDKQRQCSQQAQN